MDQRKNLSFTSRRRSLSHALNGLAILFRQEPNAKLHAAATLTVIILGIVRHISPMQWIALVFAIGIVWITEAINTCIERLCDFSCDNKYHPTIKIIKDIAAGSVLVASIVSIAVGVIVFIF